jgi:hypothetical protein
MRAVAPTSRFAQGGSEPPRQGGLPLRGHIFLARRAGNAPHRGLGPSPGIVGLALAAALALGGCGGSEDTAAGDASAAAMTQILNDARAAFPNVHLGEVAAFDTENLYEAIDGAAPYFIDSGFVRLVRGEWQPADAKGGAYVEMEFYDMGSPLGALDMLADSRTDKTVYAPIGNEAHEMDEMLEFRTGRYYVKLIPRRDGAAMKSLTKTVAEALVKAAPPGPSDEALVSPLPADKMVPHSAVYVAKEFLGHEFLKDVREAAYDTGGKRVRLFLMATDSPEKAKAAFQAWKKSLPAPPAGRNLPNTFTSTEEYVGPIVVAHRGRYLAGAIGEAAPAGALLESFLKRLE